MEDSLPCSRVEEGWLPQKRERTSWRRSPGGRSLLPPAMLGRSRGTCCQLPSIRRSHRRLPGGGGVVSRPPKDVQYHRMALRVKASQLVEDRAGVWPGTRIFIYFFSSSLPPLSPHPSFSLVSSVLTPRYAAAALMGPPRGESRGYPPPRPARGDGGM